jgi:hypothetical protein
MLTLFLLSVMVSIYAGIKLVGFWIGAITNSIRHGSGRTGLETQFQITVLIFTLTLTFNIWFLLFQYDVLRL